MNTPWKLHKRNVICFHRWFEVNELGCVVSPQGGGAGYDVSGCNSVEEVIVRTGNKKTTDVVDIQKGRMERALLQELISGNMLDIISWLGRSNSNGNPAGVRFPSTAGTFVQAVLPLLHNIIIKLADIRPACSLVYNQSEQTKLFGRGALGCVKNLF